MEWYRARTGCRRNTNSEIDTSKSRSQNGAIVLWLSLMPFRSEFDSLNKILMFRFDGRLTDAVMQEYYRVAAPGVIASIQFRASIVDFTDVNSFEVTPDLLRTLAWSKPIDTEAGRPRIVVAPSEIAYGLARLFASHGEETRPSLRIVRNLGQAFVALGVTNCEFTPLP